MPVWARRLDGCRSNPQTLNAPCLCTRNAQQAGEARPPPVSSGSQSEGLGATTGDEGSGVQSIRWQNQVHVPVHSNSCSEELGGAPQSPHTAAGEPRPHALTAAPAGCDWHWEATLPGAARRPAAETKTPGPQAPLPCGAPGRRTLPACLSPEEGPGCAPGVGLGSSRGHGGRLRPPTPRPFFKAPTSAHQAPSPESSAGRSTPAGGSQVVNPMPTGLSRAEQGSWSPVAP